MVEQVFGLRIVNTGYSGTGGGGSYWFPRIGVTGSGTLINHLVFLEIVVVNF